MSANTKKILIETESHEIFVVRVNGRSEVRGFCKTCSKERGLLTLDESVATSGVAALEIMRRVQSGETHFVETPNGHLLFCPRRKQSDPSTQPLPPGRPTINVVDGKY